MGAKANRREFIEDKDLTDRLWEKGILTWKLHGTFDKPGQLKIEEAFECATGKLFVVDSSRQLGKSTWAAKTCIEVALKKKGARIRYATAFLTDLEQFIIPAFDMVLEDCPAHLRPIWRAQKSEWYFPSSKSKIRLVGLDRKPNGLRGNRLDLVVLDEAGYITRLGYIYRNVLIPATTHVRDAKIIMLSTQPESPDHDFIKFCDKAEKNKSYVSLTIFDNPLLSLSQINEIADECGGYDSTAFRREYLCERIVESERAIVPEFKPKLHALISPQCPAWKFWHRMESLDSGVVDMTACLFGYYDFARAKAVIEHEFAIKGHEVTTPRIAELVREKERELGYVSKYNVYRRIADNNNLILIQDLGLEYQLHFAPTNKDELHAMVNKVRVWFRSDRIEIHPRCERLISGLRAGIWDKQRKQFARSETHGHFDLIAALVYFIRNIPEHENPVPAYFGRQMSETIYVGTKASDNRNANVLRKAFGMGDK